MKNDEFVAYLRQVLAPYFLSQDTWRASGAWTPALAGATTPGSFTYSTQSGRYHRFGSLVIARARIVLTAIPGAPAGGMRLTGLPFPVVNANGAGDGHIGLLSNYNYSAGALELTIAATPNQSYASFLETFDNAATVAAPSTSFGATFSLSCTVVYEAA